MHQLGDEIDDATDDETKPSKTLKIHEHIYNVCSYVVMYTGNFGFAFLGPKWRERNCVYVRNRKCVDEMTKPPWPASGGLIEVRGRRHGKGVGITDR
jgi:hypothetical protein